MPKTGVNNKLLKQKNRGLLLKLIATGECSSRIELAQKTGLAKMTVSNIVNEFLENGMLEEREKVRIGGVLEVLSFDEEGIMMETTCGLLMLRGAGMHIGKLDLDAGDVIVDGSIDSITYSDGTLAEKHSILGKLFR